MAREYRHIKQYEKEIMEMKAQGLTHREIGECLGFERKQIREFIHRKKHVEWERSLCPLFASNIFSKILL